MEQVEDFEGVGRSSTTTDSADGLFCLVCDSWVDVPRKSADAGAADTAKGHGSELTTEILLLSEDDVSKYCDFLKETYGINLAASKSGSSGEPTDMEKLKFGTLTEFPICNQCVGQVKVMYEAHKEMVESTNKFAELRDNLATTIVNTFIQQNTQEMAKRQLKGKAAKIAQLPASAKASKVLQKWKNIYTGEFAKQLNLNVLLDEKEQEVLDREQRRIQMKKEMPKRNDVTAKHLAQIQKAMTACYFTPKLNLIRKRNKLYFEVSVSKQGRKAEKHTCPVCLKEFLRIETLNIHMRTHSSRIKRYKCTQQNCSKTFSSRGKFKQHKIKHRTQRQELVCNVCNKACRSIDGLRKHELIHFVDEKPHACHICGIGFNEFKALETHMVKHTGKLPFTCTICKDTDGFRDVKDLRRHRLEMHPDRELQVNDNACEFCWNSFPDVETLQDHISKVHERFKCNICNKSCRSRDGLRKHELTHSGEKPHICHICGIGFIERKSLDSHMVKHTGKLPFTCSICQDMEGFKDAKDLRKHRLEVHPDLVPNGNANVCEFCWNSFPEFDSLQDHISKVHERYKCHICSRVFKLGDHLRRHMYIHTGEKPFKCKLCDKMFNQESNLKEHMYRHTGIRPHQCPHCPGIGYLRRVQLKEHMLKEHGTDEVPSLPMGRAAQNARKSGVHPVPEPFAELVSAQSLGSSGQIPIQGQIVLSSNGTPVFLRKVTMQSSSKGSGSGTQKLTPIIMRNVPNTSASSMANMFPKFQFEQQPPPRPQSMVLKRPIPLRNPTKRPATFEETTKIIPVHRIKKDPGGFETIETSDPNQQQIIIYTI